MKRFTKRESPQSLIRKLLHYDIISFDIFDTLLLRSFTEPSDLFLTLSSHYNIPYFRKARIEAETRARNKNKKLTGSRETTLKEIYKELHKTTGIDVEKGIALEFQKEKQFCYANPYMKLIYDMLIQNKKEIIIVSNMYLPKKLMEELLKNCGYKDYSRLYVSCDYNENKRGGGLFKIVEKDIGEDKRVIHIGDDLYTDRDGAKKIGWDFVYYPKNKRPKKEPYTKGMSKLFGSFYKAICDNYFNNGLHKQYPKNERAYYYGFAHGGPLVLGYVNYIHKYAQQNDIDKIFFLARDGYILKAIYDELYDDIPSEYILWSRRASITSDMRKHIDDYLSHFFIRRRKRNPTLKVKDALYDMGLGILEDKFEEHNIPLDHRITTPDIVDMVRELIMDNIETVRKTSERYNKAARTYFEPILKDCKKVCIVDIGWRGSGYMSLRDLIENQWAIDCQVTGCLSGNYINKTNYDTTALQSNNLVSYMFSETKNRDLAHSHNSNLIINNCAVEILATATHPSFLYFDLDHKKEPVPIFDKPEYENQSMIKLIQRGELDFAKEYVKHSEGFPSLRDISGRDAYLPLRYMTNSLLRDFKNTFHRFTFPKYIGGLYDSDDSLFDSFGEIYEKMSRK